MKHIFNFFVDVLAEGNKVVRISSLANCHKMYF